MNDFYGFDPTPGPHNIYGPGDMHPRYVDYTESKHQLPQGGRTDWGSDDNPKIMIDKMWQMIAGDNPNKAYYLAHAWWRVSELLDITEQKLRRHVEDLANKWESPVAKSEFLKRVGGALYSINEWKERASSNSRYLSTVASQLDTTKREVHRIYTEWVNEVNHQKERVEKDKGIQASEVFTLGLGGPKSWDEDDFDEYKKQKTREARKHMVDLANAFNDGWLSQGDVYKGPTNAKVVNPADYAPTPPVATRPSTPPPSRPTGTPPVQPQLHAVDQNQIGSPPPPPPTNVQGPILQDGVITPPPPPPTTAPPPPPPSTPPVGGTPPAPLPTGSVPPGGGPPPSRPTTTNLANRGAPPARPGVSGPQGGTPSRPGVPPSMQGRNASTARPPALPQGARNGVKPPAPGSGAPARPGAMSPSRPGSPNVSNRTATSRPGAPGVPGGQRSVGGRPSSPPVIGKQAKGSGAPARPGVPGTSPGAGRGGTPSVLGKRGGTKPTTPTTGKPGVPGMSSKPGTPSAPGGRTAPSLGGRAAPQRQTDNGAGASRAVRKDLGGRGAGTPSNLSGRTGPEARRRNQQMRKKMAVEPWEYDPYADEELWTVDTPGGGVIDQQKERQRPENPGPALGR